ncbi:unnamed protein product [Camellia sinensis]
MSCGDTGMVFQILLLFFISTHSQLPTLSLFFLNPYFIFLSFLFAHYTIAPNILHSKIFSLFFIYFFILIIIIKHKKKKKKKKTNHSTNLSFLSCRGSTPIIILHKKKKKKSNHNNNNKPQRLCFLSCRRPHPDIPSLLYCRSLLLASVLSRP